MANDSSGLLYLSIFSPERRLVSRLAVESVRLPTSEGEVEVLVGHAAMVGLLDTGVMKYTVKGEPEHTAIISSGTFEIDLQESSHVKILAETLELPGEVNLDRAKAAQRKAEEMLSAASLEPSQFRKYQLKLERALIRQQNARQS